MCPDEKSLQRAGDTQLRGWKMGAEGGEQLEPVEPRGSRNGSRNSRYRSPRLRKWNWDPALPVLVDGYSN
eukprot:s2119_g6.t1